MNQVLVVDNGSGTDTDEKARRPVDEAAYTVTCCV